jgi:hypothetical protein
MYYSMPINMFFIVKNHWQPYFTDNPRKWQTLDLRIPVPIQHRPVIVSVLEQLRAVCGSNLKSFKLFSESFWPFQGKADREKSFTPHSDCCIARQHKLCHSAAFECNAVY